VEVEKGRPRAEIGLLLRTINALGILLATDEEAPGKKGGGTPAVDIDSIVAAARAEKKMTKELIAIIEGREMGRVARDNRGKLSFTYNEQWRNAPDAYPLRFPCRSP